MKVAGLVASEESGIPGVLDHLALGLDREQWGREQEEPEQQNTRSAHQPSSCVRVEKVRRPGAGRPGTEPLHHTFSRRGANGRKTAVLGQRGLAFSFWLLVAS
jgi:hypothetical protein